MDKSLHDLRSAARALRRAPGFSVAAMLTLALGLGATSAIFSVVNGVLLRSLPYDDPEGLYAVHQLGESGRVSAFSVPSILEWRARQRAFGALATTSVQTTMNVTGRAEAEHVEVKAVSANLFDVLGVRPMLGRLFGPDDDLAGAEPVAVLDHGYWQRAFGANAAAVGSLLTINDVAHTVIGVLPERFAFPYPRAAGQEIFVPRVFTETDAQTPGYFREFVVATLRTGVSLEQARAEGRRLNKDLLERWPNGNVEMFPPDVQIVPLHQHVVGDASLTLWLSLVAAGLVLAVATTNVGNLVLARTAASQHERAVRTALGAGRWRLARQSVFEMLLLGLGGGGVGLWLAVWLVDVFTRLAPSSLPRVAEVSVDMTVLLFCVVTAIVVGLVLGIVPSLRVPSGTASVLAATGRRSSGTRQHHRSLAVLVAGQSAMVFALLVTASLLLVSFARTLEVDPGFDPSGRLAVHLTLADTRYPDAASVASYYERALAEIRQVPGVQAVGGTWSQALSGSSRIRLSPPRGEGSDADRNTLTEADFNAVTPGFFAASGIAIVDGRDFTMADHLGSVDVAILNQAFAEYLWPDTSAVGRRYTHNSGRSWVRVVGVVEATRAEGLRQPETPIEYWPQRRVTFAWPTMDVVIASGLEDPSSLIGPVRRALQVVDPLQPIASIRTLDTVVAASLRRERFELLLFGSFALTALALGAVGIYAVVGFMVQERHLEIGVRRAFGARTADVLRTTGGRSLVPVGIGIVLGVPLAGGGAYLVRDLLFQVTPFEPTVFIGVAGFLAVVGLLAVLIPARRAIGVDPIVVLRPR